MSVTLDVDDEPTTGRDADGRPDPSYAARLGLVPASAGRRSAAFALDALVWAVLAVPGIVAVAQLAGPLVAGGLAVGGLAALPMFPLILLAVSQGLLLVYGLVQLVLHGRRGRTLGKAALGLRSVGVARFGPPGFWRVVLRALVLAMSQLVLPVVGPAILFASSGWDPQQRGRSWLDGVGGCYVVDVRRGLDPFDAKALRHARRAVESEPATEVPRLPSLASGRPAGEELFIPSARSSSGVVSAVPDAEGAWTPPELVPSAAPAPVPVPVPVPAPAPAPAPRPGAAEWTLVFDDGTRVAASASGLLGRNPAPAPGESPGQLVPLVDESMRISKTHASYGVDDAGFWVLDRSSKNGTFVEPAGGSAARLAPGVRTPVPAGARVALGGRSFTVTMAPGR
ncbi:RDD family protein [Agromyces bauzanensis]